VLLVVGGTDRDTLRWNRQAMRSLPGGARLVVVPGAGHTFEEPGALGVAGEHVVRWLDRLHGRYRPGSLLRRLRTAWGPKDVPPQEPRLSGLPSVLRSPNTAEWRRPAAGPLPGVPGGGW